MTDPLLEYACSSFMSELSRFPPGALRRRDAIGLSHIETAVSCLDWDNVDLTAPLPDNDMVTLGEYPSIMSRPLPKRPLLSVYMYGSSCWSGGNSTHRPTSSTIPSELPAGLKELISQIEAMYSLDTPTTESDDLQEAVSRSLYLHIAYPQLVQFAVDQIRRHYQAKSPLRLLSLIEQMLSNPNFDRFSVDTFSVLSGCLVMLATDFNLLVRGENVGEKDTIREQSVKLLKILLSTKIGSFHAKQFVADLVERLEIYAEKLAAVVSDDDEQMGSALYGTALLINSLGSSDVVDRVKIVLKDSSLRDKILGIGSNR
jgi:hypothetical protein